MALNDQEKIVVVSAVARTFINNQKVYGIAVGHYVSDAQINELSTDIVAALDKAESGQVI